MVSVKIYTGVYRVYRGTKNWVSNQVNDILIVIHSFIP